MLKRAPAVSRNLRPRAGKTGPFPEKPENPRQTFEALPRKLEGFRQTIEGMGETIEGLPQTIEGLG
jgi:hypothetical protein